jgi:HAD superfamily hydrolase (TIGR01490 family)
VGEPSAAAFFDLDGTLVVGQTQALLVRYLRKKRIVSRTFLLATVLWFAAYKLGLIRVTEDARSKGARVFRGLTVDEVGALMSAFADEVMMPRLHCGALEALHRHLAAGDRVVVLSAALEPVVRALGERLGVDVCVGAPCEVVDGRYTGRLSGLTPHGPVKAEVAAGLAAQWGLDPCACWAYADHPSDLQLLHTVGHPVTVRPKPGLLEAARRAGWPVLP